LSDKKRINYSINKDINNKILEIPATENSIYDYDASYDSFKATNLNTTAKELNNVNVIPVIIIFDYFKQCLIHKYINYSNHDT
jgi:glycopeptide antibiotics resistance protein